MKTGLDLYNSYVEMNPKEEATKESDRNMFRKILEERWSKIRESALNHDVVTFKKNVATSKITYLGKITRAMMKMTGISNMVNLDDLFDKVKTFAESE